MKNKEVKKDKANKPWYKKPWGFALAVIFFPFFIIWYAWGISRLNLLGKIGITVGALFMLLIYSGALMPSTTELKEVKYKTVVEYTVENINDSTLNKGETKVQQEGMEGEKITTYRVTYVNGRENKKERIAEVVTRVPVAKVVRVGTKEGPASEENKTISGDAPAPAPAPPPTDNSQTYYANCTAARNAGAAPIYQGSPGYRAGLDRDSDGIACE